MTTLHNGHYASSATVNVHCGEVMKLTTRLTGRTQIGSKMTDIIFILKPRLHRQQIARSGCMLTISRRLLFIYVTVDLYPLISNNRRASNWQQFCCRYKKHVDGNIVALVQTRLQPIYKSGQQYLSFGQYQSVFDSYRLQLSKSQ